ncbi:MAG TPA: hypothetical protein PLG50_06075 [bacterium]|nr:hypothetical protein [bacterium]HQG45205.1 hypothetical protein [bacterium]HQI48692.1 hypothetical protein [bacterium]HQJ65053.1 hypothetical protein [bacterium]
MVFRLVILAILLYVISKVLGLLFSGAAQKPETKVRGTSQNSPLDLSQEDVEDVDYKELPRNK